jgi:hypothetical protein
MKRLQKVLVFWMATQRRLSQERTLRLRRFGDQNVAAFAGVVSILADSLSRPDTGPISILFIYLLIFHAFQTNVDYRSDFGLTS